MAKPEDVGSHSARTRSTDEATKYGLDPQGYPDGRSSGSGKSIGARAISGVSNSPLRCDMGRIADLLASSEENARRVIETAEAVAPCVLWLDEIEKGSLVQVVGA